MVLIIRKFGKKIELCCCKSFWKCLIFKYYFSSIFMINKWRNNKNKFLYFYNENKFFFNNKKLLKIHIISELNKNIF